MTEEEKEFRRIDRVMLALLGKTVAQLVEEHMELLLKEDKESEPA